MAQSLVRNLVLSAGNIQARIKSGLNRAYAKTGSANSEKVYVVKATVTGGDGTPLNPGASTPSDVELVGAVFTSYNENYIDGTDIQQGDKKLVSNSDVAIYQGDIIKQGSKEYHVINVNPKAPTSDVLAYISQVRSK